MNCRDTNCRNMSGSARLARIEFSARSNCRQERGAAPGSSPVFILRARTENFKLVNCRLNVADCRYQGSPQAPAPAGPFGIERTFSSVKSAGAAAPGYWPQSEMGSRTHLYLDGRRLVVCRNGAGPVFAACRGLVATADHDSAAGRGCLVDGDIPRWQTANSIASF